MAKTMTPYREASGSNLLRGMQNFGHKKDYKGQIATWKITKLTTRALALRPGTLSPLPN